MKFFKFGALRAYIVCLVCMFMTAQAIATEKQTAPAAPSAILSFLQTAGLAPTTTIGGVTFGGRYDSTFGVIGEASYATSLGDAWAAGLLGEYGRDTYRVNATIGRQLWQDAQAKFTAEYLDQKLPFIFDGGRIDKRVQQRAYGLQLRQNLDNTIMRSIQGGGYVAVAPGHALPSYTIINGGFAYTNQRNIAGSTSRGFDAGADFALGDSALLTTKLLYDDIDYDTRFSTTSLGRSGMGASLQLDQLLSERVLMSLKAESRSLMDSYGTELRWRPEALPLNIGLLAQRLLANGNGPDSTVVGMNVSIATGDEGYSSPVAKSSPLSDLLSWVKTPAVRMDRVQVREDQRTSLNGPVTLSISPSGGPVTGGGTVTITGTNFLPGVVVTFSGVNATIVSVTPTEIVVTVPDLSLVVVDNSPSIMDRMWAQISPISTAYAATTTRNVPIVVTNPDGQTFTFSVPYIMDVSDPILTSLSPTSDTTAGGATITLTGSTFTGATSVTFGGVAATSLTVVNDTTITLVAPAHAAGAVDVTVTTPQGNVTGTGVFTYIDPTPTISSISPTSGPTSGGTSVIVTGTNFTDATDVNFGSTAASFTVDSATQITATSPAGSAGVVDVTVTTAGGTSTTSSADEFTYIAAPVITAISPSTGYTTGGTSVTITGTSFTDATDVNFGGAAASFTVDSDTSITATSPAGSAGTVDITVTTPGGTSTTSSADEFTYETPPAIIFVTSSTYNGNLGGFSGADAKCNSDASKPSSGFASGYTYKALLNGNNATTSGVTYYRTNGTTQIATATGGNLVGSSSLVNSIASTVASVRTGASANCSSWTTSSSGSTGTIGSANSSTSTNWSQSAATCATNVRLYCVSQ